MGAIRDPQPALLIVAAFSRYDDLLEWNWQQAESAWGPIAAQSEKFNFTETDYYDASMGPGLLKQFAVFERLINPGDLASIKHTTNAWEAACQESIRKPEPRPLNIDPGYLTLAKLVLASTKDHAHRIYLADGIYAEVTLSYTKGDWHRHPWTFPDYQRADFQEFFIRCREELTRLLKRSDESIPGS